MPLTLRYAARSDVGLVRAGNEDSGYAGPRMLLVADGMGGHAAGELASAIAVATLSSLNENPPSAADALGALADAVDRVGVSLGSVVAAEPELAGMGTTVTGLAWLGGRIAVVHVGDSRAYLLRDGALVQLTHDHTYVQTLVDAGRLTEEQAAKHPRRSLLTRALDGITPVEADLSVREARVGDRYLLCSDGLTGVIADERLQLILAQRDATGCVTQLVDEALERGAPDNVTVVVADVVDLVDALDDLSTDQEPVVVGAAGEARVRHRLPQVTFPRDAQPDASRTATQPLPLGAGSRGTRRRTQPANHQRRGLWIGVTLAVLVGLVAALVLGLRSWTTTQWYVGTVMSTQGSQSTPVVAIYQGVPQELLGLHLTTLITTTSVPLGSLPAFDQELLTRTIPANSQVDAERIVEQMRQKAIDCLGPNPPAGCPTA
ncbi:MAG: protein phosphatase 2C domain-containing protein [Actinomycetales bacterium]|nr:protein phosphatase 2C domain-containing protein [Actinomycetales bacterium]